MSSPSSTAWRQRMIALLASAATVTALGTVVASPATAGPATSVAGAATAPPAASAALSATPAAPPAASKPKPVPQSSSTQKSAKPTRQVCSAPTKPGVARCLSLVRTDILSKKGILPNVTPDGYGPPDLVSAYKLPSATAGAGETVAIVDAYDSPTAEADLAVYRQQFGLPECTTANGCFKKVNQEGNASPLPTPDPGWAGEIALDLDMVSATCPKCNILLLEGTSASIDDLGTAVTTAVQMGAKYVSNSYGLPGEDPGEVDYDSYYNHPGVAVTVSSGDDGYGATWPASSPYVTAVGGTSLLADTSARGWKESVWAGAGSGCSDYEAKPDFQTDTECAKRTVADVSAVSDPNTGVAVYLTYGGSGWTVYGGTSAASPIIAATYALGGAPVAGTYPNAYPYAAPASLFDVTSGNNGSCGSSYLCTGKPGYDGPTGLGTPNGVASFQTGPHGAVDGTVKDAAGPLAGATITAGDAHATSGADGTYSLSVPAGTYDVTASKFGYKSVTKTGVVVTDAGAVTADFTLVAVPSVNVSGTVTDGSGHGWPLYAKITVDGYPGDAIFTDPFTGHYSVDLPRSATYTAHVTPVYAGYQTRDLTIKVGSAAIVKNTTALVDPSACATAPGYKTVYSGVHQTFDGTTVPAGWTVTDNNASGGVWSFTDPGKRGNLTGGDGNFAMIDSDKLGSGKSQDTTLLSPVVNLSNDANPSLELDTFYKPFSHSVSDVDFTVDGGTTWTNVWHQTTVGASGHVAIPLTAAANKAAVQVRFHFTGTFDYYWEVDNVLIGHKSCGKIAGGLVGGITNDSNTNTPLGGVTVTSVDANADKGVSGPTPDDGNLSDGFYWMFSSLTGSHPFTAKSGKYDAANATTNVMANYITRQDFSLTAGRIEATPASLAVTEVLGTTKTKNLTLKNTGTKPVHVALGEQDGGFVIKGVPAKTAYTGMPGAAVQHVKGTYVPTRLAGSKTVTRSAVAGPKAANPSEAPWQAIADFPTPISNNGVVANDGKVYSIGGFDGADDVATGYAYDPAALAWAPIADMSTTREAPSAVSIGGKVYVTGGWGPDLNPVGTTEVYDPASDSWAPLATNPKPHAGAGAAVVDGKLVVVGGCNTACGNTDVQIYDPASDSWSSGAAYPTAISWVSCAGLGSSVYCAGGNTGAAATVKTYSYDPSSDAWAPAADMPADAWGSGYSAVGGQLVVSGGVINNSATVTNEGWAFDPSSSAWTALPNSNNAFYRLGAACGFYKVGGSVSNASPAHPEAEVLPGFDSCEAGGADVGWLSAAPTELDVAPGASATVAVSFDSSTVTQPGTYTGKLTLATDTPYSVAPVDVTMNVNPPTTWGKIAGKVIGNPCTGAPAPIAGATVEIDSWAAGYSLSTAKDGSYALWLDTRNNPLTLIAAKDTWRPQTTTATITKGGTTTKDFALKPVKACG